VIKYIKSDDVQIGDVLADGHHVISISANSLGHIILRCAYSADGYPASSILYEPTDLVGIVSKP
jgi:hypothetical protein